MPSKIQSSIAAANGSLATFDLGGRYASIFFQLRIPTGGNVVFEGSPDGNNWNMITLRSISNDGYTNQSNASDFYVGSVVGLIKFRVRVTTAGSGTGEIVGVLQEAVSVIEGIEHGPPLHKIGSQIKNIGFEYATAQSSGVIYTAPSGKYFVLTDFQLTFGSGVTPGTVKLFGETDAPGNWIFYADVEAAPTNGSLRHETNYSLPFVSSGVGNSIKIISTSQRLIRGTLRLYESY